MRDPYPVIVLIPGLGLLAFQKDASTARVSAEFYESTIRIIRWAEGVDEYVPIPEQEAFDIEYLVPRRSQAAADAAAEEPRGTDLPGHRRRWRDRARDGGAAAFRRGRSRAGGCRCSPR